LQCLKDLANMIYVSRCIARNLREKKHKIGIYLTWHAQRIDNSVQDLIDLNPSQSIQMKIL
jgi:hypothetical protein